MLIVLFFDLLVIGGAVFFFANAFVGMRRIDERLKGIEENTDRLLKYTKERCGRTHSAP